MRLPSPLGLRHSALHELGHAVRLLPPSLGLRHSALHELGYAVRLFPLAIGRSSRCARRAPIPRSNQRTNHPAPCTSNCPNGSDVGARMTLHVKAGINRRAWRCARDATGHENCARCAWRENFDFHYDKI